MANDALDYRRCKTCACYNQPNKEMLGICVRYPPTVFLHMIPVAPPIIADPSKQQQVQLIPKLQSAFPETHPESGCFEWRSPDSALN